jgi:hypothetical protein
MQSKIAVYWNGEIVGYVVDPQADHVAIYGRWVPVKGETYEDFLRQFESGDDVQVRLGRPDDPGNATIYSAPDDTVEIKLWPKVGR